MSIIGAPPHLVILVSVKASITLRNQTQFSRLLGNIPETDQLLQYEASIAYFPFSGSQLLNPLSPVDARQTTLSAQEGAELNKLWSTGVLHDFNNLLAIILSHSAIALTKLPADHPAHNYVERAVRATKRAADISSQLLVDINREWNEPVAIDLNQVIKDTVDLLEPKLNPQVAIKFHLKERLSPIPTNMLQMQQIVMNLLLNATEAIEQPPGRITISTGNLVVSPTRQPATANSLAPGSYVYLQIMDTGIGMDQAHINHIFKPQFTTKPNGHGIGLASTLAIIQAHQGGIRAFSTPGRGTVVQVFLPAAPNAQPFSPESE